MRGNKAFRDTQRKVGAAARKKAKALMKKSAVARAYYNAIRAAAGDADRKP